jgi:predicted Kef-type K+ transport protein
MRYVRAPIFFLLLPFSLIANESVYDVIVVGAGISGLGAASSLQQSGYKVMVSYVLRKVTNTHSHELFTISVLALVFIVATGLALIFGVSLALGAFIAGMVVGQTEVRDKALIHSTRLKDAFVAGFFYQLECFLIPTLL